MIILLCGLEAFGNKSQGFKDILEFVIELDFTKDLACFDKKYFVVFHFDCVDCYLAIIIICCWFVGGNAFFFKFWSVEP